MTGNEMEPENELSFAELFENNPQTPNRGFAPGNTVAGTVVKISKDTVFVDLGGKSEGIAGVEEFLDKEGKLTLKEGDRVELKIASLRGGIHLSRAIKVHGAEALGMLREAQQSQIPVEGRVAAVNKGGFEVDISGTRAFCPLSQIDLSFCEKPEEHVGARYQFRIMEIKERGRNIIVSRRVLLQEEQDRKAKETWAVLQPDSEFEGRVTKLTDFGAFVDIGGVEGMVHVSEISHARINHPSEILEPGQTVKVKVLKVEPDKGGRRRIALSLKALEPDPWEKGLGFQEGDVISARVSRLADFGAFVEVAPGVDGLVHISEISYGRVAHPRSVLNEGEAVNVRVLKIDYLKRRISLSLREANIKQPMAESGEGAGMVRLDVGQVLDGVVEDSKPFGVFVRLPQLGVGVTGLLPIDEMIDAKRVDLKKDFPRGKELQVEIISIDEKGRIRLSQKATKERKDREDYEKFLEKQGTAGKLGTLGELFKNLKP